MHVLRHVCANVVRFTSACQLIGRFPIRNGSRRNISFRSRGNKISREDLTKYDGGYFLHREELQLRNRQMVINIDELCVLVSSLDATQSPVKSIEKRDGVKSRILFIRREDDLEVVVKMPFRCNGPPNYATASEVGTMKYFEQYSSVPVPKVLAWDADANNKIGSEYIVMQKASGTTLRKVWRDMSLRAQQHLIENLVKIQSQFSAIKLPCFGNLYLRNSLRDGGTQVQLNHAIDPKQLYCVGPATHAYMLHESDDGLIHDTFTHAPLPYLSTFGIAYAQREMGRIAKLPDDHETIMEYTKDDQMTILRKSITIMKALDHLKVLHGCAFPAMWRQNIDLDSVFVSEDDHTNITAILDWRLVDVAPLFIRCGIPFMLQPGSGYKSGLEDDDLPRLPDDFDSLPTTEKDELLSALKLNLATKHYERMSSIFNPIAYQAIQVPFAFDIYELVTRTSRTNDDGSLHNLERSLIYLSQNWTDLKIDLFPECPISFTPEEIAKHEETNGIFQQWQEIKSFLYEELETRPDGFIRWDQDIEHIRKKNREAFEGLVEQLDDREQARQIWPFPDDV